MITMEQLVLVFDYHVYPLSVAVENGFLAFFPGGINSGSSAPRRSSATNILLFLASE
jgi:hypothetical protein